MDATLNKNYRMGFVPFAVAAALVSLAGGFTASIPNNIVSAWGLDFLLGNLDHACDEHGNGRLCPCSR